MRFTTHLNASGKAALLASLIALTLSLLISTLFQGAIHTLEEHTGDWAWRLGATDVRERRILLVDIDETSLQQLGPWPWPRQRLLELSERLAAEGAALQIFDIILPQASGDDTQLAARLKQNNAILSQVFGLQNGSNAAAGQPTGALPWAACPANLPIAQGYIANHPLYAEVPVGHITPLVESDGNIRQQPALICHQGKAYPALFIVALAQATTNHKIKLQAGNSPLAPPWELTGNPIQKNGIPLDPQGNVRIPWTINPQAFISLSATDLLAGRLPQGLLKNAWVVIGSTALGLNDRTATPFGGNEAGFTVHAQLLRGALDGRLPVSPKGSGVYTALIAILCTLILGGLGSFRKIRAHTLALITLLLGTLLWALKAVLLVHAGLWLEWITAAIYLSLFALSFGLLEYTRSRRERDRLYRHLSSYLPGPVAALLATQDPTDAIDANRCTITALFADIRNFSIYCETHPPEESTAVLHAFFSMVTRLVEKHGGIVESFQGDAVLAVWGAGSTPRSNLASEPNPESALEAALEILKESRNLLPQPQADDLAGLELGMGLEMGTATVGSFGMARRRTHLAIGRTITTATRLQEMTSELAHPILIGEGMAASIGHPPLESQGTFLLEGLKTPCHIYAYPLRDSI